MRIALVHDWINGLRGGEKCLAAFLQLYPQADVYTLIHQAGKSRPEIDQAVKGTSWLQRLPLGPKLYKFFLPLYPLAIKSLKLNGYDLIISTSHAAAKNVTVPRGSLHICYCFTPMRYIWDQAQQYLGFMAALCWPLIYLLRVWDRRASKSVHLFVAISKLVAARIRCFYKRSANVIYPPVDTAWIRFEPTTQQQQPLLVAGALVPYKRVDLAIAASNELNYPLIVAGAGPQLNYLQSIAGPQVTFTGLVSDTELALLYASSRALLFPGKEDFGMIPVEAQAAGCPVIAYRAGGAVETVNGILADPNSNLASQPATGVFFKRQAVGDLVEAIKFFFHIESQIDRKNCLLKSQEFSPEHFVNSWNSFLVKHKLEMFCSTRDVELTNHHTSVRKAGNA